MKAAGCVLPIFARALSFFLALFKIRMGKSILVKAGVPKPLFLSTRFLPANIPKLTAKAISIVNLRTCGRLLISDLSEIQRSFLISDSLQRSFLISDRCRLAAQDTVNQEIHPVGHARFYRYLHVEQIFCDQARWKICRCQSFYES